MSRLSTPWKSKLGLASAGMLMTPEEFDAVTLYDDEEKRLQYLDLGVTEYWVIDRFGAQ
jgi:hypothetical protein